MRLIYTKGTFRGHLGLDLENKLPIHNYSCARERFLTSRDQKSVGLPLVYHLPRGVTKMCKARIRRPSITEIVSAVTKN